MTSGWSPRLEEMWAKTSKRRSSSGVKPGSFDVAQFRAAALPYEFALPDKLTISEVDDTVKGRWLLPHGADPGRRIVYFHGGGFVGGGWEPYKGIAAWLSQLAGCAVLFVDYRRAPEHMFPAAADDAYAALQWALANGPGTAAEAEHVICAGDSAGGNLAVVAALKAMRAGTRLPLACVSASGIFNLDPDTSSFLKKETFRTQLLGCYAQGAATRDPMASPLFADLAGLPPLMLQIGSGDDLLDDNLQMAEAAAKAHVEVHLEVVPRMPHVWQRFVNYAPEATRAVERLAAFCRSMAG